MTDPLSIAPQTGRRVGDLVTVPIAQKSGEPVEPPRQLVAVQVKPWTASPTMWTSIVLMSGSVLDAVLEVFIPMLADNQPFDPKKAWRPLLVAALSAVIAWRRKQQNTVIGSGA